jgi:hypothetical protein
MSSQVDSVLTGIIILLIIVVVWKWYKRPISCESGMRLLCGCQAGKCKCRSSVWGPSRKEGMVEFPPISGSTMVDAMRRTESPGNLKKEREWVDGDYDALVKDMSLEVDVNDSHKRYCNALSFAGMPTGSSACTVLSEIGRSINTSNFVGLTSRKFCKARQLAQPAPDARTTSSWDSRETCDIQMDELI